MAALTRGAHKNLSVVITYRRRGRKQARGRSQTEFRAWIRGFEDVDQRMAIYVCVNRFNLLMNQMDDI